jgi:hypothetical protein
MALPTMAPAIQGQNLTPAQAAQQAADIQKRANRQFMALSINKEVLCQQANGGALNQPFTAGQPLTYNITTANNGFLTGIWVRCALTVALGAGTNAVYQQNAASPLSLIDSIQVLYGGTQHNFRPYVLKYFSQLQGESAQPQPRVVIAGQQDSYLQSYYNNAPYGVAVGNNTYNFAFFLPMNLIHPQDVRGILPIQNGETTCQVVINCQGAPFGTDPTLNSFSLVSGSNGSAAVTGTIAIIALYKDGQSFSQLTALQPDLSGVETVQFLRDANLTNVQAGNIFRNKISFLQKMPWVFITVIDGVSPTKFASTSNIQLLDVTADAVGNRPFWRYGLNTNLDVREFYSDLSGVMGGQLQQDLDEGFFPLVYGPIFQQADAGLQEGQAYLNMSTTDGWTDFHYGVQLAATGNNALGGARVECHVVALNSPLVM